MTRQTIFSPCRTYRYALWREWIGGEGYAMFVGLNPSTADETQDDPTIRRCIAFAKAWGYAGLCMTNLFAFRATDPKDMRAAAEPVGPENDEHLRTLADGAGVIVAAWGANGTHRGRDEVVRRLLPALHCLALTKDGHPSHPLYLKKTLVPVPMGSNTAATGVKPMPDTEQKRPANAGPVDDAAEAESLKQQLATAERLALVAGLPLAAQWIRDHSHHAVVWVENGKGRPVQMLAWVATQRGLEPITCAVCGHVATEVDSLHPWHQEWDRCAAHRPR